MYVYTYMCLYTHIYMCIHICIRMNLSIYVYIQLEVGGCRPLPMKLCRIYVLWVKKNLDKTSETELICHPPLNVCVHTARSRGTTGSSAHATDLRPGASKSDSDDDEAEEEKTFQLWCVCCDGM